MQCTTNIDGGIGEHIVNNILKGHCGLQVDVSRLRSPISKRVGAGSLSFADKSWSVTLVINLKEEGIKL